MHSVALEADARSLGGYNALEMLHCVLRSLASATTTDEALQVLVSHGAHTLQPVGAVVGCLSDDVLQVGAQWGTSLDCADEPHVRGNFTREPWSDAIRLCEGIWVQSIEERKARYPDLRVGDDVEAIAMLPLVADGSAFGVLGIAFAMPHSFEDSQRAYLCTLADLCGLWLLLRDGSGSQSGVNGRRNGHGPLNGFDKFDTGTRATLTAREQQIAIALTQGLRPSGIARDLGISIYTVRKHISSILRKYDVTSQGELIARIYGQSSAAE